MVKKPFVMITIPAYNEERTIAKVLRDIHKVMRKGKYSYRIAVIDDGSSDRTAEIANSNSALVVSHPRNLGLAEAFRTEIETCINHHADIIVHTDADGQYLASDIPRLISKVLEGNDLVLGSRFKGHIEEMPLLKRWGNQAFSRVISRIVKFPISDGQTGFRAFTREVASKIQITSTHTYTQEQIIHAVFSKFRVTEIPIYFAKRGADTDSRLIRNPFEYALKAWLNILRVYRDYEPLKFFGRIGLGLFGAGFLMGLWFTIGHFTSLGKLTTGQLVLMLFLLLSGIQIVMFGFLADMNRKH
jgi:glycosyltransferase involved in cell wall biosynthesis